MSLASTCSRVCLNSSSCGPTSPSGAKGASACVTAVHPVSIFLLVSSHLYAPKDGSSLPFMSLGVNEAGTGELPSLFGFSPFSLEDTDQTQKLWPASSLLPAASGVTGRCPPGLPQRPSDGHGQSLRGISPDTSRPLLSRDCGICVSEAAVHFLSWGRGDLGHRGR